MIEEYYNVTLKISKIDESVYTKLIDFLEENKINYKEEDSEEVVVDNRSEADKWQDYWMDVGMDRARGYDV